MSAIFGIFNVCGELADEKHMFAMRETIAHYGRDGQDHAIDGNIGLGCCLSRFGADSHNDVPVYTDITHGMTIVCDALIWNRTELLDTLGLGADASTQAIILEAYAKWGEGCPKYINGDFAFAIRDDRDNRLFLARDHLGVRPLYYTFDGSVFTFATDYRALLVLPYIGVELDEIQVYALLSDTYHIDPEASYFKGMKRLPQAHAMCVGDDGIRKMKYWTPGSGGRTVFDTEAECADALHEIVEDAIRLRLKGVSGHIGAELSGGLDSSVITVLANRELGKNGGKLVALYSWSPPWELLEKQPHDERELVDAVCSQEGLSCVYDWPEAPEKGAGLGIVLTDGGDEGIFRRELRLFASTGATFILSGWGGDQGISHRANMKELFCHCELRHFFAEARYRAQGSPLSFMKTVLGSTVVQLFGPYSYFGAAKKDKAQIVHPDFEKRMRKACRRNILYFAVAPVKHVESGNIQTRTELAAWIDADYGTQHLFPFLDHRVMDFAMSLPRHWYYKRGTSRYIFRKAFQDIVPEAVSVYTYKDDPAKAAAANRRWTSEKSGKFDVDLKSLDRDIFSSMVDFDRLQDFVAAEPGSSPKNRFMRRTVRTCRDIQRMIENAREMRGG
jgi:asparagine synthase (glutamine-hydrolysing)